MHGSSFRRALPWAASVAALALLSGLQGVSATDPHVLPAPDDDDGDGLTYAEERLVGRCPTLYDTDANMVLDGIDVAATLHAMITGLPTSPVPDLPYAIPMLMLGLEECAICGEMVNMGFYLVVHPLRGIEVGVPVIALHYMEHGSIGYDGDVHGVGRVDIEGLKRVLFPSNPAHIYSRLSEFDIDEDQLYDEEEPLLGTDPADPDTDDDSLGDAPQVAERLLSAISTLPREERPDGPYIVDYVERGIETCWMCGGEMDMGFLEIVNPLEEMSFRINYMTLHYMAHGGFSALSDVHGLVNTLPTVIDVMLNGTGGAHRIPVPGDSDSDGLSDGEETALGLNPHNPDSDGDGVTDGPDLALYLYDYIGKLPEHYPNDPIPTHHVYVVNWKMLGVIPCLICGEACNMGYMEIIDPVAEKSTTLSYYGYHFMEQGSFSTDRGRIDVEALVDVLGVIVTGGEVPGPERALLSNAPNPFAGSTKIDLYMPSTVDITVAVFDAAGRKVCDIYAGEAPAGRSEFLWDGRDAAGRELVTGVYFCKIQFGSMSISKKMLKIR